MSNEIVQIKKGELVIAFLVDGFVIGELESYNHPAVSIVGAAGVFTENMVYKCDKKRMKELGMPEKLIELALSKKEGVLPIVSAEKTADDVLTPPKQETTSFTRDAFIIHILEGRIRNFNTKKNYMDMAGEIYDLGTDCFKEYVISYKIQGIRKLHDMALENSKFQKDFCKWFAKYKYENARNPKVIEIEQWCELNRGGKK